MKHINKYRQTNQYCINGEDIRSLASIYNWAKARNESLIAVANDREDLSRFTVRTNARGEVPTGDALVTDYLVEVRPWRDVGAVEVIEADAIACASGPLPKLSTVQKWEG